MKHGTKIEWTHVPGYKGETWNPWGGCSKVSAGCEHCYALRMAIRLQRLDIYAATVKDGNWTGQLSPASGGNRGRFYAPVGWLESRAIFVCSMSDFFHPGADKWREHAWHTIYDTPQHLYLIPTKRPERIPDCLPSFGKKEWPWPNVWLGASVENQDNLGRIGALLKIPAAKHFVSVEPLLGSVGAIPYLHALDWVIVGGESGPGARPMHPDWARGIRDQCLEAGVPFFFKQHGEWLEEEQALYEVGEDTPIFRRCVGNNRINGHRIKWPFLPGDNTKMIRVGKKRAGRLLDGRTWEEFPL